MAERLFVTRQTVSNWETGKSQPDIDTLIKIAETFNTDTSVLIYGMPDSTNRIKEKKKLIIVAGVLILLGIAAFYMDQISQKELSYLNNAPIMILRLFLLPLFWLVVGWEAIQGLDFWDVVKPIKAKYGKIVRIAMLLIVILYLAIVIPFLIGMVDCWVQLSAYRQTSNLYPDSSFSYVWNYPIGVLNDIFWPIAQPVINQQVMFVIPGLLFRLFKPVKQPN